MKNTDLARLVERIWSGDNEAFTELYNATYKAAYFHAKTALRNPEDIEDALQEAYVTAYQNLGRLQNPEAVAAWINQIVTFTCLHKRRGLAGRETFSLDDEDFHYEPVAGDGSTPERLLDEWGTREILGQIIEQLPEAQRLTVTLYYYDEMKISQIAAMMGCSENTVKSRLNYARKNIEAAVREEEKRGVKLYSLSPALLLLALRRLAEQSPAASGAPALPGVSAAAGGHTAARTANAVRHGGKAVGSAGSRSAASRAAGAAARGSRTAAAVSTGAKVGISSRLIAGIAAAVVLLGGVGAAVAIGTGGSSAPAIRPAALAEGDEPVAFTEIDESATSNVDELLISQGLPDVFLDNTENILTENYFPDEYFRIELGWQFPDGLTRRAAYDVTELYAAWSPISDLTGIEYFPNLRKLNCSFNSITFLDLSHNPLLTDLNCAYNKLTTLDLSQNPLLSTLDCSWNPLTTLDLSRNTALTEISCKECILTSLDLGDNAALRMLNCSGNDLPTLDTSRNTGLTELNCSGNQLTSLDVSRNTELTVLYCVGNQLQSLQTGKNSALTQLNCRANQLTFLDVSGNPGLTQLDCQYNNLTSLDISKNPALIRVDCSNNWITSVDTSNNPELKVCACFPTKS